MSLVLITPPVGYPINTAEVADYLRLDEAQPEVLDTLVAAATGYLDGASGLLGRALLTQTWELKQDRFPGGTAVLKIPLPPLSAVTSVKYLDSDGVEQTWDPANYVVDTARNLIAPMFGVTWPATRAQLNAVTVRFVAGQSVAQLAAADKLAVMWLVAHWHEHREPVVVGAANALPVPDHLERLLTARREWGAVA